MDQNPSFEKSLNSLETIVQGKKTVPLFKETPNEEEALWVKSPHSEIPSVLGLTVPEIFRENLRAWGHLPAFTSFETGVSYTHDEIMENSRGFAAELIKSGLKQRDIVAIILPNIPEFPSVILGIWEAGLVATLINPSYTYEEMNRQLQMSDAVSVITEADYLPLVKKAAESNPKIKSFILVGESIEGCLAFHDMVKSDTLGVDFYKGSTIDTTDELALLLFSSGTTGPPKGVMLTHSNVATNLFQKDQRKIGLVKPYIAGNEQERQIGLLPFFHIFGLYNLILQGMNGIIRLFGLGSDQTDLDYFKVNLKISGMTPNYLLPSREQVPLLRFVGSHTLCLRKFHPETFLAAFRQQKPTLIHIVTPIINHIVNSEDYGKDELEALHTIYGGGAPIGYTLIARLLKKAGKYFFFQEAFGVSEAGATHSLRPETRNTKVGSCGSPLPGTITKIINTEGQAVGRNIKGELCVKGSQVMKGYYKNEEATRNTIDSNGWLHTGDIGYYDEDGNLYIVDRIKELIKVQGFQVSPSELEELLRIHDKVADVAVIGIPDERNGEAPRAYIVKKWGAILTEEEVHGYLNPLISKYKQLKGGIEFVDKIPKSQSGKILRRELMHRYKEKQGIQTQPVGTIVTK